MASHNLQKLFNQNFSNKNSFSLLIFKFKGRDRADSFLNVVIKSHNFPDALFSEKEKYKAICDDLDGTFAELTGY